MSSEQENPAGNWPVPTLQCQGTGLGWSLEAFQRYWLKCKGRVVGRVSNEITSLCYELYGACWKNKRKHLTQNSDVQILQFLLNFLKGVVFCQVCHYHFHIFPCGLTWGGERGVGWGPVLATVGNLKCDVTRWQIYVRFLLIPLATKSRSALLRLMMTTFIPCWASCGRQRCSRGHKDGRKTYKLWDKWILKDTV